MVDDKIVLYSERLRDDLSQFRLELKHRYHDKNRPVTADDLKSKAAWLAETWMVIIAQHPDVIRHIDRNYLANLNIHFQRMLVLSEKFSKRTKYDIEIKNILQCFTINFVIPLKRLRSSDLLSVNTSNTDLLTSPFEKTIFIGHSFSTVDKPIVDSILNFLRNLGFSAVTGERPRANRISEKIKALIDQQYSFLGIFTRRDKITGRQEWTTSSWVIDEKAFALGKAKKLILLKEIGVGSIGGIQGDYEYIEFNRERLDLLFSSLLQMFNISLVGFKE